MGDFFCKHTWRCERVGGFYCKQELMIKGSDMIPCSFLNDFTTAFESVHVILAVKIHRILRHVYPATVSEV